MRMTKVVGVCLVVAGALGLWLSTRMSRPATLPASVGSFPGASVVMVTLDTTRADRLGCYGSSAGLTPFLDSLAARGIVFEQAQTVAPVTLPAHASMMTGLTPIKHGARNNGMFVVSDEVETLAEVFAEKGYATGAFVSAQVLVRQYGLAQGFEVFDDDLSKGRKVARGLVPSRRGNLTLEAALAWLATVPADKPVFLWLHLYDPHAPFDPPPVFRTRFPMDPYGGEIAFADSLVKDLVTNLEQSGRFANTVLTVLGDHGEGLGEHGERTHGFLLHQATIHVPWILTTPGTDKPLRVRTPVSIVDLAPLVTALAGAKLPNGDRSDGRLPFGEATDGIEQRAIYYEAMLPFYQYGWAALRGLRNGTWSLVNGTRDELFNLEVDPRELTSVAGTESLELESMSGKLGEFANADTGLSAEVALELPPAEREALQALGYLATTAPPRRSPPDPRDLVGAHVHVERGQDLLAAGLFNEALADIDQMLGDDPENIAALTLKGKIQMMMGNLERAEETFRQCLTIDPQNSEVVAGLCQVELSRGRHERVVELARIGRETRSPFGIFDAIEARSLVVLGRHQEAAALIDAKIAVNPDDPDLLSVRAARLVGEGQVAAAEVDLRKAVAVAPFHWRVRRQLGTLLETSGRRDDAVAVFEELLRIQPDDQETLYSIGSILLDSDPATALPYLEEASRLAPARGSFLTSLGVAYLKVGRMAEAESTLRRAVELDPDEPSVRNDLGIVLTQTRRFKEAVEVLTELLDKHPDFFMARNNLAIALAETGDLKAGEQEVRRALAKKADYLDGLLTLAAILDRGGRIAEEYEVLKRAHEAAPERADVRVRLALAAAMSGHCDHTLELFAGSLESPTDLAPELNLEIAKCLEQQGRTSLALRHFEQAARQGAAGALRDEATAGVQRLGLRLTEGGK